jgi:hypothetical protein
MVISSGFSEVDVSNNLELLQNFFNLGATGVSGGSTTPSSPPAPSTSIVQLLLSIIPIASPGHVITSEYHNSLRAALLAIAGTLGVAPGGSAGPHDVTVTLAPIFSHAVFDPWAIGMGVAAVPANQVNTQGWLPVELPDGALVKSMTVIGHKEGTMSTFSVVLERQETIGGPFEELITANLVSSPQFYNVTKTFQGDAGLNQIDNKKFKYMISALVTRSAGVNDLVQIYAIQLVYTTT